MITSIQNGDHPLPVVTQVSLAGTTSNVPPPLKDKSTWTAEKKKNQKIDRLARYLLIQGLSNDIYSLIDNNNSAKELWDALERHMLGSEYGEQDRKAVVLYEYETFKATEGELLLDTYILYLQVINDLKKCGYKKDNYHHMVCWWWMKCKIFKALLLVGFIIRVCCTTRINVRNIYDHMSDEGVYDIATDLNE
ncbi:hypothetical protein Tco_1252267 [Tanacetum coccineum]